METVELKVALLGRVPLFANLSRKELETLAGICITKFYEAGDCIFKQDEVGELLYIIVKGLVRIEHKSHYRKRKVLALLAEEDCFGEMALIDHESRSATAMAMNNIELLLIKKEDFERIAFDSPAILMNIIKLLSGRLRQANREIDDLTFKSVQGRIASQLFKLAEKFGNIEEDESVTINLKLTHQEIADLVGTNRESISKAISAFRKEASVDIDPQGRYRILNKELLRTWMK
ncbi:MAG: Crp/Fnr family transcriptional regulator [Planctomycetes bacterium]|nr:Crp/Fnr family transcriptional regulator [Planctomycetota bacterium]